MKRSLAIGGALIAFATFATSADARMMGGNTGTPHMSSSSYSVHTSASSSLGDSRHNNWKKPIDSDGGGPADPPTKKTGTGTGGGTTTASGGSNGGYYHGPHYYYNDPNQPSACKGRPKPCP